MGRWAGLLLLAASAPAWAQERPAVLPTRDVIVAYRLTGDAQAAIPGGVPGRLVLSWDAGSQRLRVAPEGRNQVLLVDLARHSAALVDSGLKAAMSLPVREKDLQPLTLQGARLSRTGRSVVAGLGCTDYAVQAPRGSGTVCLTEDGVALRATGQVDGHAGGFTAISVQYGAIPAGAFEVPSGYSNLDFLRLGRQR